MSNDTIQVIKTRRSVRSYKTDPVPKEVVEDIIDCARLAATGRGVQPWEFIVVTGQSTREKIADTADFGKFIAEAPVCVAVFCTDTKYYLEDGSAATQNILLGAWAHGVGSCWVAGDKKEYAADIAHLLGAPDGYRLISLVSLGYPAQAPGEKQKRPLSEVLHWEKW
jgi:nitroreductase